MSISSRVYPDSHEPVSHETSRQGAQADLEQSAEKLYTGEGISESYQGENNPQRQVVAEGASQTKSRRNKGGRPKKGAEQVRKHKYTVFLSEGERHQLEEMMQQTGKGEADLFRHALFEKRLAIPKARAVSEELWQTLTGFKRLASLHQYLSTKEKDFNPKDREQLLGSSHSLRAAIERLQRSIFVSLDKSDELATLQGVIETLTNLVEVHQGGEQWTAAHDKVLGKELARAERLLSHLYQYLSLS